MEEEGEEGFIFPTNVVTSSTETGQKESKMEILALTFTILTTDENYCNHY